MPQRSAQNAAQFTRLGITDTPAGRKILSDHLDEVVSRSDNITDTFSHSKSGVRQNFEVRESLLSGPSGAFSKLETTFEVLADGSRRLVTTIPRGT